MLAVGTVAIWYSWFRTLAVTKPPSETAPDIVTKSPATAPCDESVAVIVEEPLVAAKTIPFVVVALMGVMSLKPVPSLT